MNFDTHVAVRRRLQLIIHRERLCRMEVFSVMQNATAD